MTVGARLVQGPLGHTLVVLTSVIGGTSNRGPSTNQWRIGEGRLNLPNPVVSLHDLGLLGPISAD
ncbi:hypothetical protein KQI76_10905 [Amphibacillus sp. MSJ-3]|uniref:hypothetical protein n=1 Tax=Amphibacillus sp. MSJ-3 TaxID=2841505 RepID=UPI001C0EA88F|nr:hypothetical protein [Amphibacillus sp. MSJ-3]MBU5595644.1 hypothetical protein [Amphibacillus sp. MSJ-3]